MTLENVDNPFNMHVVCHLNKVPNMFIKALLKEFERILLIRKYVGNETTQNTVIRVAF